MGALFTTTNSKQHNKLNFIHQAINQSTWTSSTSLPAVTSKVRAKTKTNNKARARMSKAPAAPLAVVEERRVRRTRITLIKGSISSKRSSWALDPKTTSPPSRAKDEQISDFIRGQYKSTTGSDVPIKDKETRFGYVAMQTHISGRGPNRCLGI